MITSKLIGGLGNQMFQIANVYAYSMKYNLDYGFDFNSCYTPNQGNVSIKYINSLFKNLPIISSNYNIDKIYKEKSFGYNEIPYYGNINLLLDGYFQSEKYFYEYSNNIRSLFHKSDNIIKQVSDLYTNIKSNNGNNITSVHVRRGDYLKHPNFHLICDEDYYIRAMSKINKEFGNTNFIFISDDIDWCKKTFKNDNISYSPFTNDEYDLLLMSICDNQIISNSTFSWWGTYLNENDNKMVVSPNKWFGLNGPKEQNDIILNNWVKI